MSLVSLHARRGAKCSIYGEYMGVTIFTTSYKRAKHSERFLDPIYHKIWFSDGTFESFFTGSDSHCMIDRNPDGVWTVNGHPLGDAERSLAKLTSLYLHLKWSTPRPRVSYTKWFRYPYHTLIMVTVSMGTHSVYLSLPFARIQGSTHRYAVSSITSSDNSFMTLVFADVQYQCTDATDDSITILVLGTNPWMKESPVISHTLVARRVLRAAFRDETHFGGDLVDLLTLSKTKI